MKYDVMHNLNGKVHVIRNGVSLREAIEAFNGIDNTYIVGHKETDQDGFTRPLPEQKIKVSHKNDGIRATTGAWEFPSIEAAGMTLDTYKHCRQGAEQLFDYEVEEV